MCVAEHHPADPQHHRPVALDDRLERRPGRLVVDGREPLEQFRVAQPADGPDLEQPLEPPADVDPSSIHAALRPARGPLRLSTDVLPTGRWYLTPVREMIGKMAMGTARVHRSPACAGRGGRVDDTTKPGHGNGRSG